MDKMLPLAAICNSYQTAGVPCLARWFKRDMDDLSDDKNCRILSWELGDTSIHLVWLRVIFSFPSINRACIIKWPGVQVASQTFNTIVVHLIEYDRNSEIICASLSSQKSGVRQGSIGSCDVKPVWHNSAVEYWRRSWCQGNTEFNFKFWMQLKSAIFPDPVLGFMSGVHYRSFQLPALVHACRAVLEQVDWTSL